MATGFNCGTCNGSAGGGGGVVQLDLVLRALVSVSPV